MRKPIKRLAIGAAIVATAALWGVVAVNAFGPSPEDLAADIAAVDKSIAEAKVTGADYAPESILGVQLALRVAVLETTRDMLDQKRRSWLRGIDLVYRVDGRALGAVDPQAEESIRAEVAAAASAADAARIKAAQYTGGLLQGMILVEEQTHLVTLALANQRLALARLGLSLPASAMPPPPAPIGQVVDDAGAL